MNTLISFEIIVPIIFGFLLYWVFNLVQERSKLKKRVNAKWSPMEFDTVLDVIETIAESELNDYIIGRIMKDVRMVTDINETVSMITTNTIDHIGVELMINANYYVDEEFIIKYVSRFVRNGIVSFVSEEEKK